MTRDHRRLAAIVSLDVAGYSRLMGKDEGGTLAAFKAHRRELIDPKITEHDGRIVKTTGDGLLLEFASVVDAVRCAVEIQRGMAERTAGIAEDKRLDFRIGINVGDIIIDGDDIFGDGVNVAARVESLAEPGGICVSRVVRDQVLDKLDFTFEDLGPQQVKNIVRPVEVYRVDLGGKPSQVPGVPRATWRGVARAPSWRWLAGGVLVIGVVGAAAWLLPRHVAPATATSSPPGSLAVLSFTAPTASTEDEQLAQRFTVDLTSALQRSMPWTSVVSHRLASTYKGKAIDARQVGHALNVRYLVEGEVRGAGQRTVVKARLIETSKATEAWSDEVAAEAPGDTQDRLALMVGRLTNPIKAAVIDSEERRVLARPVSELNAAELTFRADAVALRDPYSPTAWADARKLYDMALRLDPNETGALMGQALALSAALHFDLDPRADRDRLIAEYDALTVRLVTTAGREPQAWDLRADALAWQWRWEAVLEAHAKSQALDPTRLRTAIHRVEILYRMGRPTEALALADQLRALRPQDFESNYLMLNARCEAMLALGRYADAIAACEKQLALGDSRSAQMYLVAAYALQGDAERARTQKAILLSRKPDFSIARHKALRISDRPAYLEQVEAHLYAGLRKAGIPER